MCGVWKVCRNIYKFARFTKRAICKSEHAAKCSDLQKCKFEGFVNLDFSDLQSRFTN